MPQCPFCKAAVWAGQHYCTTCTKPLPQDPEAEEYFCPQCGNRMATPHDICQRCQVPMPEIALISTTVPARIWRLPLKVPGILMGATLLIVGLFLVFPAKKGPAPPQMLMAPPSKAVMEQTAVAPSPPAANAVPATPTVAAVREITIPSAPATPAPPAVTPPTSSPIPPSAAATTATSPPPRYFVNTQELSVRDDADTSSPLISTLNFKDEVELLETSGGWGRVRDTRRDLVGWVYMRYLQRLAASEETAVTTPSPASEKAPAVPTVAAAQKLAVPSAPGIPSSPALAATTPALPRYFVNTNELSVRNGPDPSAALITTLNLKDEVEILETSGGWGRVREMRRDLVGWVNLRYLQPLAAEAPRNVSPQRPSGSDSKEPESITAQASGEM